MRNVPCSPDSSLPVLFVTADPAQLVSGFLPSSSTESLDLFEFASAGSPVISPDFLSPHHDGSATDLSTDEDSLLSPEFDFVTGCVTRERLHKQQKKLNRLSRNRDVKRVKKSSRSASKKLQQESPAIIVASVDNHHHHHPNDNDSSEFTTPKQEQLLTGVLTSLAAEFSARFVPSTVEDRALVKQIIAEESMQRADGCCRDPFFIVDLGRIAKKYVQFKAQLPRVRPFYAVKCNPSRAILKTILSMGGAFDCASSAEIMDVLSLSESINPRTDIIFANPCKSVDDMRFAREQGVRLVTFDNEYELYKFAEHWPDASLVLRIITDDSHSVCQFSSKFGASLRDSPFLLATAKQLGLTVVGISFHVGSGCGSTDSYVKAVRDAHHLFQMAQQEFGFPMSVLDLGGGWPGTEDTVPSFSAITDRIRPIIDELFEPDVQVIAEPGRYFAAACHTLACNVSSKRAVNDPRSIRFARQFKNRLHQPQQPVENAAKVEDSSCSESESESEPEPEREFLYYINDGVYGSFNCLFFDHAVINPLILDRPHADDAPKFRSTIFGPTCDSLDCIAKRILMPELHVGDWLFFEAFGAYTSAAASAFNGFKTRKFHYIVRT